MTFQNNHSPMSVSGGARQCRGSVANFHGRFAEDDEAAHAAPRLSRCSSTRMMAGATMWHRLSLRLRRAGADCTPLRNSIPCGGIYVPDLPAWTPPAHGMFSDGSLTVSTLISSIRSFLLITAPMGALANGGRAVARDLGCRSIPCRSRRRRDAISRTLLARSREVATTAAILVVR